MEVKPDNAIDFLLNNSVQYAHMLGFDLLKDWHGDWISDMITAEKDKTLQAHRNSYKTTCVSIAISIIMILQPQKRILFIRKTDNDVKEIVAQVKNILMNEVTRQFVKYIYNGKNLAFTTENATMLSTNLRNDIKGTEQLTAYGIGASLTGKHYDIIFTDDIVNIKDKMSKAERELTKIMYQELDNVKNKGGRKYNTGTPWHKEDAFTLMPEPKKFDVYTTGIFTDEEIEQKKKDIEPVLFAANYELRHIASDKVTFAYPRERSANVSILNNAYCQVDAAFDGSDYTAFTAMTKKDGKYYIFGKMWRKHVDDVRDEIVRYHKELLLGKMFIETNADKGYVAKSFKKAGVPVMPYFEKMNKYIKIVTYLKAIWSDAIIIEGTDKEYIEQICDFTDDAEHDDAPDSASVLARRYLYKKENSENQNIDAMYL